VYNYAYTDIQSLKFNPIKLNYTFNLFKFNFLCIISKSFKKSISFLRTITYVDIYFDKNDCNFVNIGIRFEFQSDTTTLTNEIIEEQILHIKKLLVSDFNSKIR
jgi:phenylalanyl-tRNA synthetase beta subunit